MRAAHFRLPSGRGRALTALPLLAWPGMLLASVMSLGAGSDSCFASMPGLFVCTTLVYPAVWIAAVLASAWLLRRHPIAALLIAFLPLVPLLPVFPELWSTLAAP